MAAAARNGSSSTSRRGRRPLGPGSRIVSGVESRSRRPVCPAGPARRCPASRPRRRPTHFLHNPSRGLRTSRQSEPGATRGRCLHGQSGDDRGGATWTGAGRGALGPGILSAWKGTGSVNPVLKENDPMDCSPPGSSVHGIFQAIELEWIAISFSRGSSQPRD